MALLEQMNGSKDIQALSVPQLEQLAGEIRAAIIEQVQKTGGHLAPNLGVVELTLAMHYVFDFAHDRLLFDVGHQCYPHKLVTGRFAPAQGPAHQQGHERVPRAQREQVRPVQAWGTRGRASRRLSVWHGATPSRRKRSTRRRTPTAGGSSR
jgi:1-deoxy-D-xylulose-5-phosphate synthase